jgi:hypothetical protein
MIKQYLLNILWALDRLGNALMGGSSKEFISTRIYNNRLYSTLAYCGYLVLNRIDPNHCERAAHRDYDPDHSSDDLLNKEAV